MPHNETKHKDITEELGTGKILPMVFRLTVPAVIAQLITFLYNIVDRMYVSRIEGSGMDALAALGIVLPITLIMTAFANLVGLGGSPRAGIRLGENNREEANCIFNTAFVRYHNRHRNRAVNSVARQIVAFGCPQSAVEFAVSYLKIYSCGTLFVMLAQGLNPFILTQGYSFIAMSSVLIGAVINIILDPLFIFVLGMGVQGSGLATIISQMCSCVCIICFFFSKKSIFRFRISAMRLTVARIADIVSLGFTPFVMAITECAIQIVFNINLNRATGGDKDYTAALTVMLSALQLISLPLNGLGNGMQPFVSYNYGKGNAERLKKGIKYVTIISFIFAVSIWSISMAVPEIYAQIFSASDNVTYIVREYTPFFLMGSIMFFVQMTLQNVNVALGQAKSALMLAVTRKVIILIPLCFVLTHFMGFKGVYLSEGIADLTAGIITSVVIFTSFPRIFREREELVKKMANENEQEQA
ncbi:MAG: MATE family efflux transporter [Clostridia bacterium]